MKKRILSVFLAICLLLPFAAIAFAAVRYLDSVSININIMEETGIERANDQLSVYAYAGAISYSDSIISDRHWYIALTEIEEGKTAADYEYDAVNSLYLKEMTAADVFEKCNTYAVRFKVRAYSSESQFAPGSAENVKINGSAINSEGYNGTYTLENFDLGSTTLTNAVISVYSLLPASSVKDRVYDVRLYGTEITKANKDDVFGNGTAQYVPATAAECAKLYLNNFVKTNTNNVLNLIYAEEDLDVIVSGSNELSCSSSARGNSHTDGIYSTGNLTIKGSGSLTLKPMYAFNGWSAGIYCTKNVTVCEDVTLRSTTNEGQSYTYGIHSDENITIKDNAKVYITNAGYATNAKKLIAIGAINLSILDNTTVQAENRGHADGVKYGVYVSQKFTFTGDKLITNVGAESSSRAIRANTYDLGNSACFGSSSFTNVSLGGTSITSSDFNSSTYRAIRIEKAYKTTVNGKKILVSTKDDVLGDGTVRYIPAEGNKPAQLDLDGASLNKISAEEDIVIDVLGSSAIDSSSSTSDTALYVNGKCHLKGDCLTVKGGSAAIGIRVTDFFNLGLDELTVDAKTALSAAFIPKSSDEVYVDHTYCSEDASAWDETESISSYSHVYIVSHEPYMYVNGVLVTEDNQNDFYETEHWYAEMPGINSVDMVLHLEGVNFTSGRGDPYGIYGTVIADGDLTIELSGENTVTSPGNVSSSINAPVFCSGSLTVNGADQNEDVLYISSTLSNTSNRMENYALFTQGDLTLNNCKVFAYAPNCYSDYSIGVSAFGDLYVEHAYVDAVSRNASSDSIYSSVGIEVNSLNTVGHDTFVSGISYGDSGYGIRLSGCRRAVSLTGGTFIAGGRTAAFEFHGKKLVLDDYIEPLVYTSTENLSSSTEWNGTTPFSDCKYVKVVQGSYNVSVGGIKVTPLNASDIFGDSTAVLSFDDNKCPVLTLTDADITGFSRTASPLYYACIWSKKPLTIILNGNCTVDCGEGEINSVAERKRYAVYCENLITMIANADSVTELSGCTSVYTPEEIGIILNGNAVLNCSGLENTSSNISCYDFTIVGDGGYTFNVVNPGAGSCITVDRNGFASFISESTEVFSHVDLRHNCPDFPEIAVAALYTMKPICVRNVFLTIRGFLPTPIVIPRFFTESQNEAPENTLITISKYANAAFSYKWSGTEALVDRDKGVCYDYLRVEPYYDTFDYADVNGDEVIDENDYTEIVNKALSDESEFPHKTAYDLNRDSCVDVLDCVLAERMIHNYN